MLNKEVEELLEAAFCAEHSILEENFSVYRGGQKLSAWSYRRSKTTSEHFTAETECNLYDFAWDRIAGCKENGFPCALVIEEENRLVLVGGSGAMQMNPAVVELLFSDTRVEITAWAKEGFIKQKTAQKAVRSCIRALGLMQS